MNLKAIKELAFEQMGNRSSHKWKEKGNKYYHGERVAKLVLKLRKYVLPDDDSHDDILTVAAWFHDIMNGNENHAEAGAERARDILAGYCSEYELEEICKIISVHDDRSSDRTGFNDYIKLQQDADHLDHFGIFDIWIRFFYAAHHNETLNDVIDWFESIHSEEYEKYRNELNFDISRQIYDEKCEFVNSFGERMSVEGRGGFWDEAELR